MEQYDVLIVGGGPAGSTCAWQLQRSGMSVAILDRAVFPRDKVCAGWITPAVVEELQLDLEAYRQERTLQPITGFITGFIGRRGRQTDYDHIVSYGIRRREFDDCLLRRCGVPLYLNEPLASLQRMRDRWVINEHIQATIVIGAGGHFCPVARHFTGEDHPDAAALLVAAQEVEFEMTDAQRRACPVAGTHAELYFCRDLRGYGWVFRKGNFLNIGLGRAGETHLANERAAFVEFLKSQGRIPHDVPDRFHGHAYRLRGQPREAQAPGVLLIGDSAGLADWRSGEGIRPAIESGLLAARAVLECRTDRTRHAAEVFREMRQDWLPHQALPHDPRPVTGALRQLLARCLMSTRWFTRHMLLDDWFLHASRPPLRSDAALRCQ